MDLRLDPVAHQIRHYRRLGLHLQRGLQKRQMDSDILESLRLLEAMGVVTDGPQDLRQEALLLQEADEYPPVARGLELEEALGAHAHAVHAVEKDDPAALKYHRAVMCRDAKLVQTARCRRGRCSCA